MMLGRAIFGNPWLFDKHKATITIEEKVRAALEHTALFTEVWGDTKSFELMKKHYQAYINHFPQAKELRVALMDCHSIAEVKKFMEEFLMTHKDVISSVSPVIAKI